MPYILDRRQLPMVHWSCSTRRIIDQCGFAMTLNKISMKYMISLIVDLFDMLDKARYFIKLDLGSGYTLFIQICIRVLPSAHLNKHGYVWSFICCSLDKHGLPHELGLEVLTSEEGERFLSHIITPSKCLHHHNIASFSRSRKTIHNLEASFVCIYGTFNNLISS